MKSTKESINTMISFETFATQFQEEASSLLPKQAINEVLDQEGKIWQCAQIMHLPQSKYIGNNMRRYCKERLREKQPFYRFYLFLCFIMELSTLLLITGALIALARLVLPVDAEPLEDFPVFYLTLILSNILFVRGQSKKHLRLSLATFSYTLKEQETSDDTRKCILTQNKHDRYAVFSIMLSTDILLIGSYYFFELAPHTRLDLLSIIDIYVITAIISGIHNMLYSSHAILFFMIGVNILSRHTKEEIDKDCAHYETLSYIRILSRSGQPLSFEAIETKEAEIMANAKASLKARLVSMRIYVLLGLVLFLILGGVCIGTMLTHFSIPLMLFTITIFFGICILLTALLSANRVMKDLR